MKKLFVCLLAACLIGLTSCSEDMAKDLLRSALGDILETGTETTETDPNAPDATETEKEPEKETETETEKETETETEKGTEPAADPTGTDPAEYKYKDYALDVPLRIESGRNSSSVELPMIVCEGDGEVDNETAIEINVGMAEWYKNLYDLIEETDTEDYQLTTFCFTTDRYLSAVTLYICYPTYGTDGVVGGFCFDKMTGKKVELEDALKMAGMTEEKLAEACKACAEELDFEGVGIDSIFFRMQPSGKPEFFIGYTLDIPGADTWVRFFAWYDGSCILIDAFRSFIVSETDYVMSGPLSYQITSDMGDTELPEVPQEKLLLAQQFCFDEHDLGASGLAERADELPITYEDYGEYDGKSGWWISVSLVRADDNYREEFLERFFIPDDGDVMVYDVVTDTCALVPVG